MTLEKKRPLKGRKIKAGYHKPAPPSGGRLRAFKLGEGLPSIPQMRAEVQDMTDVLMGREDPPLDAGYLTLQETADAYYARASELTMLIQAAELDGRITRGSSLYKYRTGELRTFAEMCKRAADLGSRRLTAETLKFDQSRYGRESAGHTSDRYGNAD